MEKLALRFNTDFEVFLFDQNYNPNTPRSRAMIEEFEYFLFWIKSGHKVYSKKYYSDEYLDYIKNETGNLPEFCHENFINFMSNSDNKELNKKLSSKLTFYQFLQEYPELQQSDFKIIKSLKEIDPKSLDYPIIIKNPNSFSGIGNLKASSYLEFESHRKKMEQWLSQSDIIIEKFIDKKIDLGVQIENDEITIYENLIGKQFQYQGSQTIENIPYDTIFKNVREILSYYIKLGFSGNMSVDLMICKNGHLHFHEVNPRKSMGYIFKQLDKLLKKNSSASGLYIYPSKKLNYFESFNSLLSKLPDAVKMLSPLSTNMFVSFYIQANDLQSLSEIKLNL